MNTREYKPSDFNMLKSWWNDKGLAHPTEDMIPETTYILEDNGIPVYSASLFLMNCKAGAMLENLISNPNIKDKKGLDLLIERIEKEATFRGYNTLIIYSSKENVKDIFSNKFYIKTQDNVSSYAKRLI